LVRSTDRSFGGFGFVHHDAAFVVISSALFKSPATSNLYVTQTDNLVW